MAEGFNIGTLNVRGAIKHNELRKKIISCVKLYDLNILMIQETHVNNLRFKYDIDRIFDCQSFWSFGSNDSRGVAILVMNNFEYKINKFENDNEGRLVKVEISSNSGDLNIVSVYAPNDGATRKTFFRNIDNFIIGRSPTIIGGDFNCVENLKLDKIGGNPSNGTAGSVQLNSIKQSYNLIDPFRTLYKKECSYTWSSESTGIKTRLDRYYIDKSLIGNVTKVHNINPNVSDHKGVIMNFDETPHSKFNIGKGIWKFNDNLLKNENFIKEIEQNWLSKSENTVKMELGGII